MSVYKYVKKPIPVDAIQYDGKNVAEIDSWMKDGFLRLLPSGARYIKTLEGDMKVSKGDYIICGVEGEYYPCKKKIFEKTYQPIL